MLAVYLVHQLREWSPQVKQGPRTHEDREGVGVALQAMVFLELHFRLSVLQDLFECAVVKRAQQAICQALQTRVCILTLARQMFQLMPRLLGALTIPSAEKKSSSTPQRPGQVGAP